MESAPLPSSRTARSAVIARLAGEQAARNAATKAANLTRSPTQRRQAAQRRHGDAIDQIVRVLGTMKGAAMKIGQMFSVVDLGFLPAAERERLQARLAELQDSAPAVPFTRMLRKLEGELGDLQRHFATLEPEPIAAASIGQVFRGELHDGRTVAVKVQYPGVAPAVAADLKNLRLIVRMLAPLAPGIDFAGLVEELTGSMLEELDYRREAAHQGAAARRYAGHPFVCIPQVIDSLCTNRVLVTEFVRGRSAEAVQQAPAAVRNRVGEILCRFYCGSIYRFGEFPGDPHPGNYLLTEDGRVAMLDFGLCKRMDPGAAEVQRAALRAMLSGDDFALRELMIRSGFMPAPDELPLPEMIKYTHRISGWLLDDLELEITPDLASASLAATLDPRSPHFEAIRHQNLPREHLLARRAQALVLGMLGSLRATGNWHRIAREWVGLGAPSTPLGQAEAIFFGN